MLRILLIVAIVAGLATAGINLVTVREKLVTTMNDRDQNAKDRDDERAQKDKAKKELTATKGELDTTKTSLTQTTAQLATEKAKADEQTRRATELAANLDRTRREKDTAQQQLNAYSIIGIPPEKIRTLLSELKTSRSERDAFLTENKILIKKINKLDTELSKYIGPDKPVILPSSLRGTVVAVDPKFDFVVLDIGEEKGVLERGQLLVNRNGRLIAKIQITSVERNRSYGNVLPGWRNNEVQEGDQVLP